MCNCMDLNLYMVNENFEEIETTLLMELRGRDVFHRHLILSRGYETILNKIIRVTKDFGNFLHEIHVGMHGS